MGSLPETLINPEFFHVIPKKPVGVRPHSVQTGGTTHLIWTPTINQKVFFRSSYKTWCHHAVSVAKHME